MSTSAKNEETPPYLSPNRDYFGKEKTFFKQHELNAPWFLRAFASKFKPRLELHRLNPERFTMNKFKAWKERMSAEAEILSQSFIQERHNVLGSDLATAHFIVFRGGKVKFVGQNHWIQLDEKTKTCPELPTKYDQRFFLEAIDASGTEIRYEGLENFINLSKLKWLSFRNCPNVDEWFVDRLTGELGATLEYLDLSDCPKLKENFFSCMYRCSRLKELVLENVAVTPAMKLSCLLLEDSMKDLVVSGVNYQTTQ